MVTIRAAALLDGTIVRFKIQHPFGDAEGITQNPQAFAFFESDGTDDFFLTAMLRVAQAFCAILDGEPPPQPSDFRPPISLKEEVQGKAKEISIWDKGKQIARLHGETFVSSWFAGLARISKQRLRNLFNPSSRRVNRTVHIPQEQIDKWIAEVKRRGVRVTVHDLVLAFIHQQTARPTSDPPFFGIIMNIQRQLEFEASFGNPWLMIPLHPRDSTGPKNQDEVSALVDRAVHIRHTINAARRPHCVAQIIDQHCQIRDRPFVPRVFASRAPQPIVSSWADHSLWDLEIQGKKPALAQASISFYGLMRSLGFIVDDVLVVWKGDGDQDGYWVQGHLSRGIWAGIKDKLLMIEGVEEKDEKPPEQEQKDSWKDCMSAEEQETT